MIEEKKRDEKFNPIKGLELILTTPSRLLMKGMDKLATSDVAKDVEQQIPKTLTGIAEAPLTLATGTSAFIGGLASQAAKTADDIFGSSALGQPERMSAAVYELWRSGFKDVSGEGFRPREILKKFGQNKDMFDKAMEIFTHQPKTEAGQGIVQIAASPITAYEGALDFIGNKVGMSDEEREGLKFFARLAYPKVAKAFKNMPTKAREATSIASTNKALKSRYADMEAEGYSPINIENAMAGERIWKSSKKEVARREKEAKPGLRNTLVREFVDISGNVKREFGKITEGGVKSQRAKNVIMHHDLAKGSTPRGLEMVNESNKRITSGLTSKEIEQVEFGVKAARELAIKQYKPKHIHPENAPTQVFVDQLHSLPANILERVMEYEKVMRESSIDRLLSEGLISKEQHTNLASKGMYAPRELIEYMDTESFSSLKPTGKESVESSGLKNIKQSSDALVNPNAMQQLADTTLAVDSRIAENRVGKSLYRLATNEPENGYVSVVHPSKMDSPPPRGREYIYTMIDGRKHAVSLPKELASEFVRTDPVFNQQLANTMGWMLGTKILKMQATGYNPNFALRNVFRDAGLIWLATEEYSSAAPIMAGQLVKDIVTVLPDAIMKKGRYKDYVNEGGSMAFLTQQGQLSQNLVGPLKAVQDVASYLNNLSETMTRLALRDRAIKNGKSQMEATHVARNYLDFPQGGRTTKAMDAIIPYLNPSVQGTRSVFRAAKNNPVIFTSKIAQVAILAQGLYLANKFVYGDKLDEISQQDRINNWNVILPLTYKDETGVERNHYIKIPKDQSQRALSILFEGMMAKAIGDEDYDYSMIVSAGKQALPVVPTEALPPLVEAAITYGFNKDMWTNEDIWKGSEQADKTQEYTNRTPPVFVKGAKAIKDTTGMELSPERMRTALGTIFTRNNPYTDLVGIGFHKLMGEMPEQDRHRVSNEILQRMPGIKEFLGSTNPQHRLLRQARKVKLEENTRRTTQNRLVDDFAEGYYENKELGYKPSTKKFEDFVKTQPLADATRLIDRFMHYGTVMSLPNRSWWLTMSGMPTPEARAATFYGEWKRKDDPGKMELFEIATKMQGIISDRFLVKFVELGGKPPPSKNDPSKKISSFELIY